MDCRSSPIRRAARLAAALCVLLLALATAAAAETRVALVIGNGAYANLDPLKNPVNDASDIANSLRSLGFEVMSGTNLTKAGMTALISDFLEAAQTADASFFYYAGHGFQIDGGNFLVPVDASLRSRADIENWTIRLDDISDELEGTPGIHLVFLDACRTNPLSSSAPALAAQRDGLARVGDAAGFLFAFATQPDNVAYDGLGRNSFFAQALLGHLNTPGQDVASMMIAVRKDVLAATGGNQVPWENSSLTRQFEFAPGEDGAAPETLLWQLAATARDPALMHIYLDRYPEGPHIADVRALLADTEEPEAPADIEVASRDLPPPLAQFPLGAGPAHPDAAPRRDLPPAIPRRQPRRLGPQAPRRPASGPTTRTSAPGLTCERLATHDRDGTANVAGVPLAQLRRTPPRRSTPAAGRGGPPRGAALHRAPRPRHLRRRRQGRGDPPLSRAADRGDLRAMNSLGLVTQTGDGVPEDLPGAAALYEKVGRRGPSRRGDQPRRDARARQGRAAGRRPRDCAPRPAPPPTGPPSPPTTSGSSPRSGIAGDGR